MRDAAAANVGPGRVRGVARLPASAHLLGAAVGTGTASMITVPSRRHSGSSNSGPTGGACISLATPWCAVHSLQSGSWGHSSVGRASGLHPGGRGFEPRWLHLFAATLERWIRVEIVLGKSDPETLTVSGFGESQVDHPSPGSQLPSRHVVAAVGPHLEVRDDCVTAAGAGGKAEVAGSSPAGSISISRSQIRSAVAVASAR